MGMTNAERQKKYREKALHDPDGHLLTRLQVMLSASAAADLERLQKATGRDKRQLVDEAITAYYKMQYFLQFESDREMQRAIATLAPSLGKP